MPGASRAALRGCHTGSHAAKHGSHSQHGHSNSLRTSVLTMEETSTGVRQKSNLDRAPGRAPAHHQSGTPTTTPHRPKPPNRPAVSHCGGIAAGGGTATPHASRGCRSRKLDGHQCAAPATCPLSRNLSPATPSRERDLGQLRPPANHKSPRSRSQPEIPLDQSRERHKTSARRCRHRTSWDRDPYSGTPSRMPGLRVQDVGPGASPP
jgi:hypothetical protein